MSEADHVTQDAPKARDDRALKVGLIVLGVWFIGLWLIPDPRPLGAPEWAVSLAQSILGVSEPGARAVATFALRGLGLALIGILLAWALRHQPMRRAALIVLVASPVIAIVAQWLNYGYFPIYEQRMLALVSTVLGGLLGLGLRKNYLALGAFGAIAVGLFAWGTSTGIPDDLYEAARATAVHVLDNADEVPAGDRGFEFLLEEAFNFARENSHRTGAVFANRAAILALGVILGEERVAWVARRPVNPESMKRAAKLRNRIRLRDRPDLSRHFWVSAGLAVLSDEERSMTVGITKELMDSTPGGSGFSFVDLTADRCGTLFEAAATRSEASARALQARIREGARVADFCPPIDDLPEGLTRDQFQNEYGGLGGKGTQRVVDEIRKRIQTCEGLK